MGAMIDLNGHRLGNATDQFVLYTFSVGHLLNPAPAPAGPPGGTGSSGRAALNVLNITFGEELMIATNGRFTHSAQIDWAPGMPTIDPTTKPNMAYFGFGIWKSVYLVPLPARSAAITQLVLQPHYAGGHPTTMLNDTSHDGFDLAVRVELHAPPTAGGGTLSVAGTWPGAAAVAQEVVLAAGSNNITLRIPAAQTKGARLWHPHGHGDQVLYNVTAKFTPHAAPAPGASDQGATPAAAAGSSSTTTTTTRRTGFRDVALVTVNDTDPAVVAAGGNGTGRLTMFFRVNGAAVYARGANKVQMDLMDGRMSAEAGSSPQYNISSDWVLLAFWFDLSASSHVLGARMGRTRGEAGKVDVAATYRNNEQC